jgi:deoxyribose-phosphate aldolase
MERRDLWKRDLWKRDLWKYIDHTLLKPDAAWVDIRKLCDEALEYGAASVCVPPSFVAPIRAAYPQGPVICTVIGFPLGYHTPRIKAEEAREAAAQGAAELDMVINLGEVKSGNFDGVTEEIRAVRQVCPGKILKVIVEACYLTGEEKIRLCRCVTEAGADFIKTSTGFGSGGAVLEDVRLFKAHIGPAVQIKAAGGISTLADLEAFIAAGCTRIGTSRGISILGGP